MFLSKILKKTLSVFIVVALLCQQSGLVFATTNVSNWSDLQYYVTNYSDTYNVTTPLTASSSSGTLYVNNNGRTVTGSSLTQNGAQDTLISVGSGVTFTLGNSIYGSISNSGTLNYTGSYLSSGSIYGTNGTLNIAGGTVQDVISGTGNVQIKADTTLSGNNTYTGSTLIDGKTLTIANQDNLVSSDILFANDGLLVVSAEASLDNILKGQAAADNVRVQNDADLTLNTAMGESADFHKTGNGVMTFAMDSNGYAGDTYVEEGTLIGNTLNINHTVIGSDDTTINFNDTTNAELNEINTSGNFVKSASALLNVETNAFTAAQADINSGIFAVNRVI